MAENSKIEWTNHTFNPWIGCAKVSQGCRSCYAESMMDHRYGKVQWGPNGTRVRTSAANWRKPLQWDRQARAEGRRYKVFCASLADVFEDRADLMEWRRDLIVMIEKTSNIDWLLLTKRPENVMTMLQDTMTINVNDWFRSMSRVWIGTSVENQEQADLRIPHLLKVPAAVRFLSCEPLLGPVDLTTSGYLSHGWTGAALSGISWCIVGGESGPNARPMNPRWARDLRDQCVTAGVPYFFKQYGEWAPPSANDEMYMKITCGDVGDMHIFEDRHVVYKVGKKTAGRVLDGQVWAQFPQAVAA